MRGPGRHGSARTPRLRAVLGRFGGGGLRKRASAWMVGAVVAMSGLGVSGLSAVAYAEAPDLYRFLGWTIEISARNVDGKTRLVVQGESGTRTQIGAPDATQEAANPATFTFPDADQRIPVSVSDPRGASWSETLDVPRGMTVTLAILGRFEHRGFEGTIRNQNPNCRKYRSIQVDLVDATGRELGVPIALEAGKTAPGIRLQPGRYEVRVSTIRGIEVIALSSTVFEPTAPDWRLDVTCE